MQTLALGGGWNWRPSQRPSLELSRGSASRRRLGQDRRAFPRAAGACRDGEQLRTALGRNKGRERLLSRLLLGTEGRRGWFCLLS